MTEFIGSINSLDLLLLAVILAYAISGYVQGFVVNLVATIGLLIGGLLMVVVVPRMIGEGDRDLGTSMLALGLVVAGAAIGQALGTFIGTELRTGVKGRPLRWLDAVGGSVLSIVAVLCAGWALGYSVSGTSIPYVSQASRDSAILRGVNGVMPGQATTALRAFNKVLDSNLFPRYIDPFETEEITEVGPPDESTLQAEGVVAARRSVVKILGQARCNRGIEGTGFSYAPGRIMTNAHVVAGVGEPTIEVDGRNIPVRVVVFDAALDIAVLATDVSIPTLKFDTSGRQGDAAAVLGYPENGPYDARAARIRERLDLRSPDIYDRGRVERDTFAVRSLVRSGNSGGPLVSPEGDVLGVIFAASISDRSTGYALTADQVAENARKGIAATGSVSTGDCA